MTGFYSQVLIEEQKRKKEPLKRKQELILKQQRIKSFNEIIKREFAPIEDEKLKT